MNIPGPVTTATDEEVTSWIINVGRSLLKRRQQYLPLPDDIGVGAEGFTRLRHHGATWLSRSHAPSEVVFDANTGRLWLHTIAGRVEIVPSARWSIRFHPSDSAKDRAKDIRAMVDAGVPVLAAVLAVVSEPLIVPLAPTYDNATARECRTIRAARYGDIWLAPDEETMTLHVAARDHGRAMEVVRRLGFELNGVRETPAGLHPRA